MRRAAEILYEIAEQYPKSRLGRAVVARYDKLSARERLAFDLRRGGMTLRQVGLQVPGLRGAPSISPERTRQMLHQVDHYLCRAASTALGGDQRLMYVLRIFDAMPVFEALARMTDKEEELPMPPLTSQAISVDVMELYKARDAEYYATRPSTDSPD